MLSIVTLMVLVASTATVSPPGPSCRLRVPLPQPMPQPPIYRPPYRPPTNYYPQTRGIWVCYTSYGYGYGGAVPYAYGARPASYWPYGAAVAAPVAAAAPVAVAAPVAAPAPVAVAAPIAAPAPVAVAAPVAAPVRFAVAAPAAAPAPVAAPIRIAVAAPAAAPAPVAAAPYPYYAAPAQVRPVTLPYPLPATLRRARKTRSTIPDEAQQQALSDIAEYVPQQAEPLPAITDSSPQPDHPLPPITNAAPQAKEPLPSMVEATPQADQPLSSFPAGEQPFYAAVPSSNTAAGKLAVSVVFSTSNSYMHNFFTHQLYPAVHALGIHLTLDLLPQPDGGCEPGSSKCLGSSLMVCAAETLPLPTAQLAFSACFMKATLALQDQTYSAVMNTAKMCMGPFSVLNWMQMASCVSSGRGEQLFDAATKRLNLLAPAGPQSTPIVAFNQEVVIADASALNLFPALLCQQLSQVSRASAFCSYNTLY